MRARWQGNRPVDRAAERVRTAARTGDPVLIEHAARAYSAAVHRGMLDRLLQGARRIIDGVGIARRARRW